MGALSRWWRTLWPSAGSPTAIDRTPDGTPGEQASADTDGAARPVPARRRYTAAPPDDDPLRETHLGAVLQVLSSGETLDRAELGQRVGATQWGPGRLDAVVDHGIATGVLRADGDRVRARYTD